MPLLIALSCLVLVLRIWKPSSRSISPYYAWFLDFSSILLQSVSPLTANLNTLDPSQILLCLSWSKQGIKTFLNFALLSRGVIYRTASWPRLPTSHLQQRSTKAVLQSVINPKPQYRASFTKMVCVLKNVKSTDLEKCFFALYFVFNLLKNSLRSTDILDLCSLTSGKVENPKYVLSTIQLWLNFPEKGRSLSCLY